MSSMMKKLTDQLSGAKKARQEKRMKREMREHLTKLQANGNIKLAQPEKGITLKMAENEPPKDPEQPFDAAARAATEGHEKT